MKISFSDCFLCSAVVPEGVWVVAAEGRCTCLHMGGKSTMMNVEVLGWLQPTAASGGHQASLYADCVCRCFGELEEQRVGGSGGRLLQEKHNHASCVWFGLSLPGPLTLSSQTPSQGYRIPAASASSPHTNGLNKRLYDCSAATPSAPYWASLGEKWEIMHNNKNKEK
ncbi:hypothetical protein JZ751_015740, partial [Albula glossodonta]